MSEENKVTELTVDNPPFEEREENWNYSVVEKCISLAIDTMKKVGGRDISFKVKFEPFMTAEFWIPNDNETIPDELPWEK